MTEFRQGSTHPETFHDIQDDATGAILRLTPILVCFYALSIGLLVTVGFSVGLEGSIHIFSSPSSSWIFVGGAFFGALIAVVQALIAYLRSFDQFRRKTGAESLDDEDHYHSTFRNIVQEIGIASPISNVQAMVIPTARTNAMAVGDQEQATVYLTEGALGCLRRDEIQAVVAHEVAHLAYGDSRLKYFTSSIVQTFDWFSVEDGTAGRGLNTGGWGGHQRGGGRAFFAIAVMALLSVCLKFINRLLSTSISQKREWRADATAIEYCRDPISLASALYKLGMESDDYNPGDSFSGTGIFDDTMSSPSYESLLVVPFDSSRTDKQSSSWFDRLLHSHPPLYNRIEKALKLAHTPFSELQSRLDKQRSSPHFPVRAARNSDDTPLNQLDWFQHVGGETQSIELTELLTGARPGDDRDLVASEDDDDWNVPSDHPELSSVNKIFQHSSGNHGTCPECNVGLRRRMYLGVPLEACILCGGVLIPRDKIIRVQSRYWEGDLPDYIDDIEQYEGYHGGDEINENEQIQGQCPDCGGRFQTRRFQGTGLIIDRCNMCSLTWFEEDELMIALTLD